MRQFSCLCLLFTTASLCFASTSTTQPLSLADNAALRYWPAFSLFPTNAEAVRILRQWQNIPIDDSVRKLVNNSKSLQYLSDGAKIQNCDWGLEYKYGPRLLLPQLNKARELSQLALLRARVEFADHQNTAAIDDITNVWVLARHVGTDKTFIGLLVRYHIEKTAVDIIQPHIAELNKAELDHLAQRFDTLPPGETLADTIPYEQYFGAGWLLTRAQQASAVGEPVNGKTVADDFGIDGPKVAASISQMMPDELAAKIHSWDSYYTEAGRLLRQEKSPSQTEQALSQLRKQYGNDPLTNLLLPNYAEAFRNQANAQAAMDDLRIAISAAEKK